MTRSDLLARGPATGWPDPPIASPWSPSPWTTALSDRRWRRWRGTPAHRTGQGQYADIQAGAPVTITDSTGGVIGVSHLGTGHRRLTGDVAAGGTCDFEFVVGGIPEAEAYGIRFERRGTLQYSLAEMKQQRWTVRVELRTD